MKTNELVEYYRDFPIDEHVSRADRLRVALRSQGLDAALLTYEPNIRWLVGYHTLYAPKWVPMAVLLTCGPDSHSVFMCATDATGSDMAVVDEVRLWDDRSKPPYSSGANPVDVLIGVLKERGLEGKRVGMELGRGMRLDLCQNDITALRGGLPLMEVEDVSGALWRLRSIKSEREIEKLRKAAEITLQGYGTGFDAMREGMTEKELAAVIGSKWLELGASSTGSLFLAAGWRSVRYAHVDPVEVPVRRGEIVNLDGGCTVDGYRVDVFRMACIGQPTNKEEVKLIRCIIEAKNNAITTMKPGVTCGEIWTIATQTLERGGFGHLVADTSVGHGVGLEMHEWPTLSRGSQHVIKENMVFCVEPWTMDYSDWSMGRNHEDMVRITAEGTDLLSPGFEDLVVLPVSRQPNK